MYEFNYHRPGSLDAALSALSAAEDGKFLAGGQTLLPTMKQRLASPSDLNRPQRHSRAFRDQPRR